VYGIAYTFGDPLVMALSLHKGLAKTVVREHGIPTCRWRVVADVETAGGLDFPLPAFIKPVAEGTGKGVTPASKICTADELRDGCRRLLKQFQQPVLVEEYLPGREFTVGIVGSGGDAQVLGTLEIILLAGAEAEVYSYVNKERCEELVEYRLVQASQDPEVREAERIALAAWRALECRDAGRIDLRSDVDGRPQFMEANPLAGLHPQHSDLPMLCTAIGMPYVELIRRIVESAALRVR
jgi:D-alanine-D-alanine ligase